MKAALRGLVLVAMCVAAISAALGQGSAEITNERVIQMTKAGLGDEIIIAKMKAGTCRFNLNDNDLVALKKAGVSDKVVAAMLETTVLTEPRMTIDGKPLTLHTFGQAKIGGRLGAFVTGGIKSVKQKSYLQGPHAGVIVSPNGAIEMELPRGDNPENYIIVRLDGKDDRRELETASAGGAVGGKSGVRSESIVKAHSQPISGNKHKLLPEATLGKGEYVIYVLGSADTIKGIFGKGYDFTVE